MQLEGNIWIYIVPFIPLVVAALVYILKKGSKNDANAGMVRYEVNEVKNDVKEIKIDVKELHEKSQDALRQIDVLDIRLRNVEEDHKRSRME